MRPVEKKDIQNQAKYLVDDLKKHLRPSMNEWLLEDFEEWYGNLQIVMEADRRRGIISKEIYQDWLAGAREYWSELVNAIREHEAEEDYIHRLCNPISS